MKNYILIGSIFLLGCSSNIPKTDNEFIYGVQPDTSLTDASQIDSNETTETNNIDQNHRKPLGGEESDSFLKFYKQLMMAIGEKNYNKFNECIHPDHGLYVIELRGAMPKMYKYYDISNYKSPTYKPLLDLSFTDVQAVPVFDSLPKVICGGEVYDKYGCYAQSSDRLKKSQIWNYANLNEKEIQAIEFLVGTVQMTVVNTSNYTFHFSFIDGKWYVAFIDIRTPCSA